MKIGHHISKLTNELVLMIFYTNFRIVLHTDGKLCGLGCNFYVKKKDNKLPVITYFSKLTTGNC